MIGGNNQSGILFQVVAVGVAVGRSWQKWRKAKADQEARFKAFFQAELEAQRAKQNEEGRSRRPSPQNLMLQPGGSQERGHTLRL